MMAIGLENIVANTAYLKAREGEEIVLACRVCMYVSSLGDPAPRVKLATRD